VHACVRPAQMEHEQSGKVAPLGRWVQWASEGGAHSHSSKPPSGASHSTSAKPTGHVDPQVTS
jgi:hypothetical protein